MYFFVRSLILVHEIVFTFRCGTITVEMSDSYFYIVHGLMYYRVIRLLSYVILWMDSCLCLVHLFTNLLFFDGFYAQISHFM